MFGHELEFLPSSEPCRRPETTSISRNEPWLHSFAINDTHDRPPATGYRSPARRVDQSGPPGHPGSKRTAAIPAQVYATVLYRRADSTPIVEIAARAKNLPSSPNPLRAARPRAFAIRPWRVFHHRREHSSCAPSPIAKKTGGQGGRGQFPPENCERRLKTGRSCGRWSTNASKDDIRGTQKKAAGETGGLRAFEMSAGLDRRPADYGEPRKKRGSRGVWLIFLGHAIISVPQS